ncbi:TetR/AcrR family transcriptional regulator [Mycobacteroides abscessus]|uniref:TetR/AcrR family transcriptional regulator n=1 Tax=Mycobacteroides abscessus TaxID=36809 RepID=UPI000926290F|nr:TetR/AcrR family transcriptional regulator [Mycobacteroides abscessus]MDO3333913.1 TetR/AcrR family transcriptional regulator [Mycobacteroides abscessus subsp. bolletii]QSM86875.1 helix-turn-helix transcriptional regulator [Mycobacteroides abscessus subsp. bolletii]SIB89725.1 TetR family transcriptional regulator [Mycobacteroides abscessus subsp. bolletii]SKS87904.1 TetR family transcriptional regulator [Mycobacteroides abscessus subsp. bolletii]SKT11119.1 TetR family transcriptional regula
MRRQQQALATRAALVAAARELWSRKGFFATSTSDIVAAAGVGTRGAFYAHFPDREQLFLAVMSDVQSQVAMQVDDQAPEPEDALIALQTVLLAFLDIVVESPDIQALLVDGPAVFGIARWHRTEQSYGLAPIELRLADAVAQRIIDDQPIQPLATILLMLVNDTALMIAAADDRAATRRDAGAALSRMIEGLRSTPSPPGRHRT